MPLSPHMICLLLFVSLAPPAAFHKTQTICTASDTILQPHRRFNIPRSTKFVRYPKPTALRPASNNQWMTLQQPPRTYSLLLPEVITQHRAHQTEHSGTMALPFHCARAAVVHHVSRYPSASSSGCAPGITSSTSPCALFHIATLIISFNQPFPIDSSTCALNLIRRQEKTAARRKKLKM